jgi:FAD-dependent urate hydroxylase
MPQHDPDIGQGGCAAMEDAVVLGNIFRENREIVPRCGSTKRCARACAT